MIAFPFFFFFFITRGRCSTSVCVGAAVCMAVDLAEGLRMDHHTWFRPTGIVIIIIIDMLLFCSSPGLGIGTDIDNTDQTHRECGRSLPTHPLTHHPHTPTITITPQPSQVPRQVQGLLLTLYCRRMASEQQVQRLLFSNESNSGG